MHLMIIFFLAHCRLYRNYLKGEPVIFIPDLIFLFVEQREFTLQRVKKLLHSKIASIYDMKSNPTKFLAFLDCVTVMDVNLAVKFGVHMTLFGSSVINLGTEKHHKKYLPGIDTFEIAGCFGMTELGTTTLIL